MQVYVIGILPSRPEIKVGITDNIDKRIASLQTGNARKLYVAYQTKSDRAKEIETLFFLRNNDSRLMGEWFKLRPAEAIASLREILSEGNVVRLRQYQFALENGGNVRRPQSRKMPFDWHFKDLGIAGVK
jgi:hypothetical protein